jgi:mannose-6-phosphate isomerase-like protein (cupin superfamily)
MRIRLCAAVLLANIVVVGTCAVAAEPIFLRRSLADIREQSVDLSTATAHYKPLFGIGDPNAGIVKGIERFGELTIAPGGTSEIVSCQGAEGVFFILAGSGTLHYGAEKVPVKENDFMYLPVGVKHGISNRSQEPLRLLVMGFRIPAEANAPSTPKLMMANTDDVKQQVLSGHGPSTQFKLLLGTIESKRDELAAARQINSLFLMDFAPGGTNIPHRHAKEEEIYYVLRGRGDMVAGTDPNGKEVRYPVRQGDVFYFAPGTLIGFYSGTPKGEGHAQILAVRSACPVPPSEALPSAGVTERSPSRTFGAPEEDENVRVAAARPKALPLADGQTIGKLPGCVTILVGRFFSFCPWSL